MKKFIGMSLLFAALAAFVVSGIAFAGKDAENEPLTLAKLSDKIEKLEKKEVVLSGTIIGVCKSGCKMWIADGDYKEGDAYALVRAKDDAFKFDTDASGKVVVLHGYAVAKYMDYCSEKGEEQEGKMKECDTPVATEEDAEKRVKTEKKAEKRELKDVTFFATKVVYK